MVQQLRGHNAKMHLHLCVDAHIYIQNNLKRNKGSGLGMHLEAELWLSTQGCELHLQNKKEEEEGGREES